MATRFYNLCCFSGNNRGWSEGREDGSRGNWGGQNGGGRDMNDKGGQWRGGQDAQRNNRWVVNLTSSVDTEGEVITGRTVTA